MNKKTNAEPSLHIPFINSLLDKGFDAIPSAICIFDKDGKVAYMNADYCDYIRLSSKESALGRDMEDILRETGVEFRPLKSSRQHLRVRDVLKRGKAILNWEVEVIRRDEPGRSEFASTDIYPILAEDGTVLGVAEMSRPRKKQIRQIRNVLGLSAEHTFEDIIGSSPVLEEAKRLAKVYAESSYNILIYGESGVGKELFAQSIHNYSERRSSPFVAINCASIPPELIDGELFGYESGAFTGASKGGQMGKFELADGGTLFLDEIAELPLPFQTKLLRTLETRQITRIGGGKVLPVDVRVIAATNRSLEKMVEDGLFRQDLYYRLMVLSIEIPPLRDHPEDLLPCCRHFLEQFSQQSGGEKKTIAPGAERVLFDYDWPGNIRELRNVMNRACIWSSGSKITEEILQAAIRPGAYHLTGEPVERSPEDRLTEKKKALALANADVLREALAATGGNKRKAAELLGISRGTLYHMLEQWKEYL